MAVSTQSNIVTYNGDGVTTVFGFEFPVLQESHLTLYAQDTTSLELDHTYNAGEYDVDLDAQTVTLDEAPDTEHKLIIARIVPYTQELDVNNQGGFYPDNVEDEFDTQEMQIQQIVENLGRTLQVGIGDSIGTIPRPAERAETFLGFDTAGALLVTALTATTASGTVAVTTVTLLQNIAGPTNGQLCYLSEDGREGWFQFSTANLSSQVTADTQKGIYIPPSSDTTGASGAWVRTETNVWNVRWFGADNTGVSSAVTSFNAAVALANATVGSGLTPQDYKGLTIGVPDGEYKIDASLTAITKSGITFMGQSKIGTILTISATGVVFEWQGGAGTANMIWGGGCQRMTLRYTASPNANAILFKLNSATAQEFNELTYALANTICQFGVDATHIASAIWFNDCNGYVYNSGKPSFDLRYGSAAWFNNVSSYVYGVAAPAIDRVSTMTTVAGTHAFEFTHGGWDTFVVTGGSNFNRYYRSVYVNAAGSVFSNFWLDDDTIYDFNAMDGLVFNAVTNAAGGIFHVSIGKVYVSAWSGHGIIFSGDNGNAMHKVDGANIYLCGKNAIDVSGAATRHITITNCRISNPNRLVGTYQGINLQAILGPITITDNMVLDDPGGAFSWEATYGITVVDTNYYYTITGNDFQGSSGNYNIDYDNVTAPSRIVHSNLHADYIGWQTTGIFVAPASATVWHNYSPFDVEVSAFGMDLGLGKMDINGVTKDFGVVQDGSWIIKPGEGLFVAYTGPITIPSCVLYFDVLN